MAKTLGAAGVAAFAGLGPLDSVSFVLFGTASSTTVFMALVGAAISYAYNEGESGTHINKKKMYFNIIANTLISTAAVTVLPAILGWEWYSTKLEGSVALLIAASARFMIPIFIKLIPEIVRKWFKLGEYNQNRGNSDESI